MEITPPPSSFENAPVETTSLPSRLLNIYAAPGEVFDEIKSAPVQTMNWLIPLILACVMGVIYTVTVFSQEGVLRAMQEMREQGIQKNVATKKMTQAQADQTTAAIDKFMTPNVIRIFGAFSAVISVGIALFFVALILWLIAKYAHTTNVSYMKLVEVCGLCTMIDVLQKLVRTFLGVWKGNILATASPTLFIDNPVLTNKLHIYLSMLDVIDIWWLAVLSLGLSKVASIGYGKSAAWLFCLWFSFRVIATLLTPS